MAAQVLCSLAKRVAGPCQRVDFVADIAIAAGDTATGVIRVMLSS